MGATHMGAPTKWAQNANDVKIFHEFTEVPNDEGNKRISLVSIVSTVELGNKELFGRPKIVPYCQKFLIIMK